MESRIISMKRKRSSSQKTTDLCGSFLVNVLDLSKILNGKNKSKTVHKLSCLKELLDISGGSSSTSDETIVISDTESDTQSDTETPEGLPTIKKETLFEHKKMSRLKRNPSESEDDSEEDISKIKNYVKESLLKGLAINSHNFNNNEITNEIKQEPAEEIPPAQIQEDDKKSHVLPEVESTKEISQCSRRKRIRLTERRSSSYQGKRLLRYYRNLKRRPKIRLTKPRIETIIPDASTEITISQEYDEKMEENQEVEEATTTEMVPEEEVAEEVPEEILPSSTTNDQDILTLSRLEELKVQITEDENTVYITILDGTITIPDVLQVLNCSTPESIKTGKMENNYEIVEEVMIPEVNPYFSQNEYKSVYTNASSTTGTNVKTLYEIITYPEVKKNLVQPFGPLISTKKVQKTESPYSYKTINESVFTLAPTNCNYINHVHWTNSYPLSYETNVQSHRHLCVLKDLYQRSVEETHSPSNQPLDMRCNYAHLPKLKKPEKPFPPFIPPPTSTTYHYHRPTTFHHHQESQRYNSHYRRNLLPLSQSVDVSYARQYMEQQKRISSPSVASPPTCRYPQSEFLWKQHQRNVFPPAASPSQSQTPFIDIPIYSPTYNIKIPPLRIPITAITPVNNTYKHQHHANYHHKSRNSFKEFYQPRAYPEFGSTSPQSSSNIMRNLLQMEPKSRFVWS